MHNSQPSEHAEQTTLVAWFDRSHPSHRGRLFAIPNGGHRHKAVAAKMALEGCRRGVPDLMLPVAAGGYHGLFVEMKRSKGGSTSKEQREWIDYLRANGYRAEVCAGHEAAKAVIGDYLEQT